MQRNRAATSLAGLEVSGELQAVLGHRRQVGKRHDHLADDHEEISLLHCQNKSNVFSDDVGANDVSEESVLHRNRFDVGHFRKVGDAYSQSGLPLAGGTSLPQSGPGTNNCLQADAQNLGNYLADALRRLRVVPRWTCRRSDQGAA